MSYVDYLSLPRKPKALPFSDYEKLGKKAGLHHNADFYENKYYDCYSYLPSDSQSTGDEMGFTDQLVVANFTNCFENPLIYSFYEGMMPGFRDKFDEVVHGEVLEADEQKRELDKLHDNLDYWQRHMFYSAIDSILNVGEFVEKYIVWTNHVDYDFGPPTAERTINLKDVLSMKKILHHPKGTDIGDGYKITIIKSE